MVENIGLLKYVRLNVVSIRGCSEIIIQNQAFLPHLKNIEYLIFFQGIWKNLFPDAISNL